MNGVIQRTDHVENFIHKFRLRRLFVACICYVVDFTGNYVLHCHILAHEDRGMMEMVQVVGNVTSVHHH